MYGSPTRPFLSPGIPGDGTCISHFHLLGPDSLVPTMTEAGGATTSSLDLSLTQTRCPQGMDMSLASLLQCLDSGHRSPVPVCNLEPLYCPKYTLVSQEGPLLGVQAFHLRPEEVGMVSRLLHYFSKVRSVFSRVWKGSLMLALTRWAILHFRQGRTG